MLAAVGDQTLVDIFDAINISLVKARFIDSLWIFIVRHQIRCQTSAIWTRIMVALLMGLLKPLI